jgi:hypothetical protein
MMILLIDIERRTDSYYRREASMREGKVKMTETAAKSTKSSRRADDTRLAD